MAKNAIQAVDSGELKIIPENHVKIWHHWMDNMRYLLESSTVSCYLASTNLVISFSSISKNDVYVTWQIV